MSSLSYSHTLSVWDGDTVCGRCCSFQTKPYTQGSRVSVHKGNILRDYGKDKAVVKIYHATNVNEGRKEVKADIRKFQFVRKVFRSCPGMKNVQLAKTYESEVDKVGKLCRTRQACLCQGAKVLVQEFVPGEARVLFHLGKDHNSNTSSLAADLGQLAQQSYELSGGTKVIARLVGVAAYDDRGRMTYEITSWTVHSVGKQYGEKDLGVQGIELYRRWSGLSAQHPQPSAPPPSLPLSPEPLSPCGHDLYSPQLPPYLHHHADTSQSTTPQCPEPLSPFGNQLCSTQHPPYQPPYHHHGTSQAESIAPQRPEPLSPFGNQLCSTQLPPYQPPYHHHGTSQAESTIPQRRNLNVFDMYARLNMATTTDDQDEADGRRLLEQLANNVNFLRQQQLFDPPPPYSFTGA